MRGSRVIVEGFIDFDYEITLLTVRANDADGVVQTHFCEPIGHVQVHGDYVESWQPQPMSAAALARARDIAGRVTGDLGGRGIFGVELFVKGDQVWFSEVSPRPHDTGMVTMCTQAQSEFELHARAILGLPVDVRLVGPGASAVIYGGLDGRGIALRRRRARARRAGKRSAPVRQAGGLQATAHGRGARHGPRHRAGTRTRERMRAACQAARLNSGGSAAACRTSAPYRWTS